MRSLPYRGSALAALGVLGALGVAAAACGGIVVLDGTGGDGGGGGGSCTPAAEVCDGFDNDCDGTVDDGCACLQDQTQACYTGTPGSVGKGACVAGTQVCLAGSWGPCEGEVLPDSETCNGLDDNCDGDVDENLGEETCGIGGCQVTQPICQGGVMTGCVPPPPAPEICDGVDNDCDTEVDEGDPGSGGSCTTGDPGACSVGVLHCMSGSLVCVPTGSGGPEICDGLDNDCDGQADDGDPGGGAPCATGLPGVCAAGTLHCAGGALACAQNQQPAPESCDGLDNNCDGMVDAEPCGCNGTGIATCVNGQLVCSAPNAVYFEEDFSDNSAGWQLGTTWQIGPATLSSGQVFGNPDPAADHSATSDNGVAGVVIGGNAPTNVHDAYYLTSPAINTAGASTVSFSFWRWLNSDYMPFMQNTVEVYNGTSWVTLWQSGGPPGTQDASWQEMSFDLTQYKNANMRVRFGQRNGPQAGAFSVSSWNIDDVVIASAPCQ